MAGGVRVGVLAVDPGWNLRTRDSLWMAVTRGSGGGPSAPGPPSSHSELTAAPMKTSLPLISQKERHVSSLTNKGYKTSEVEAVKMSARNKTRGQSCHLGGPEGGITPGLGLLGSTG